MTPSSNREAQSPARYQQDTQADYLLGRFDARRMLRLEGMPSIFTKTFRVAYEEAKQQLPDLWRNITYVAPALNYPEKRHADWTSELLMVNAETLGTRQALARTRDTAITSDRRIVTDSPRPLEAFIRYLAWHEHGHGVLSELELSDIQLGTSYLNEFSDLVAGHVDGYKLQNHWQAHGLPYSQRLARLAPSAHSRRNHHELFADLLAHYYLGDSSPLIRDAGHWIGTNCAAQASSRADRQHSLLEQRAVAAVQRWERVLPGYSSLGERGRAAGQASPESDLRFLAACDLSDAHFVGSQQVAMAHRQPGALLNPDEVEASKSVAANLGLTTGWS